MGYARWSQVDWNAHAQTTQRQTASEIFTQNNIHPELDPLKFEFRESRDSKQNPNSTPIILAIDVTASNRMAEQLVRTDLGTIMSALYDRKPVPDPHIMCMAIGDASCDRAPIQVSQFEASIVLADQLKNFYLEGGGGGNQGESYPLAWLYAGYKTKCDAIKRGRKGYIFTIGDESPHPVLTREQLKRFLNMDAEADMRTEPLLHDVQRDWNIFHLIENPVRDQDVVGRWRALLGDRAIVVEDLSKLASGIVGIIEKLEGQWASAQPGSRDNGPGLVKQQDVILLPAATS